MSHLAPACLFEGRSGLSCSSEHESTMYYEQHVCQVDYGLCGAACATVSVRPYNRGESLCMRSYIKVIYQSGYIKAARSFRCTLEASLRTVDRSTGPVPDRYPSLKTRSRGIVARGR